MSFCRSLFTCMLACFAISVCLSARALVAPEMPKDGPAFATDIADHFVAALKGSPFLNAKRLADIREDLRKFAMPFIPKKMTVLEQQTLLQAIDNPQISAAGDDYSYLSFPDRYETFKWKLWRALIRKPFTQDELIRRNAQQAWLHQFIMHTTNRPGDGVPNGIKPEELYAWALRCVDEEAGDPLSLLFDPFTDEQFARFQKGMASSAMNGLTSTVMDLRMRVLDTRRIIGTMVDGGYQEKYEITLPFKDTVISVNGGPSYLCFASNAFFKGKEVGLCDNLNMENARTIFNANDSSMPTVPKESAGSDEAKAKWAEAQNLGDLSFNDASVKLLTLRGARMAELPVTSWFAADQLSNESLHKLLAEKSIASISLEKLRPITGIRALNEVDPVIFLVIETREKKLTLLKLTNREFGMLYFWVRQRAE